MRNKVVRCLSFHDIIYAGYDIIEQEIQKVNKKKKVIYKIAKDGEELSPEEFQELLFQMGLDPFAGEKEKVLGPDKHRTLMGDVAYQRRFMLPERLDKDWLDSGYASDEALATTSGMRDMATAISSLQRGNRKGY